MLLSSLQFLLPAYKGFLGKCPACAKAKLFRTYLKPYKICTHCHQDFDILRADDGPAWLTIIIISHIIIPLFIYMELYTDTALWIEITLAIVLSTISVLLILPYVKGFFMGIIWITKNNNNHTHT